MKWTTSEYHALCPDCGDAFELATGNAAAPVEGDLNLCLNCGAILIFAMESGRLISRHLTIQETYEYCHDPKWSAIVSGSAFIKKRGKLRDQKETCQ